MEAPLITISVRHFANSWGDEFWKRCKLRKHLRWTQNGVRIPPENRDPLMGRGRGAKTPGWGTISQENPVSAENDPQMIERSVELFLATKTSQGVNGRVGEKYH